MPTLIGRSCIHFTETEEGAGLACGTPQAANWGRPGEDAFALHLFWGWDWSQAYAVANLSLLQWAGKLHSGLGVIKRAPTVLHHVSICLRRVVETHMIPPTAAAAYCIP